MTAPFRHVVALTVVLVLSGCGADATAPKDTSCDTFAGIAMDTTSGLLVLGRDRAFDVTAFAGDATPLDVAFAWASVDERIVSFTASGAANPRAIGATRVRVSACGAERRSGSGILLDIDNAARAVGLRSPFAADRRPYLWTAGSWMPISDALMDPAWSVVDVIMITGEGRILARARRSGGPVVPLLLSPALARGVAFRAPGDVR